MSEISLAINKREVTVFSDGEECFTCLLATLQAHNIADGDELDAARLNELRRRCLTHDYTRRACYLLGIKDYSEKALAQKLGPAEDIAAEVCATLRDRGLLDDARYAQRRAQKLVEQKLRAPSKAVYTLMTEGIDRETAQAAVQALQADPTDALRELIQRKYFSKLSAPDGARKVCAALLRQGYEYDDIKAALRDFTQ